MSCLVIDTNTFSMGNITDLIRGLSDFDAFNILKDVVASGQVRGMHYTHTNNLGEAEKAAFVDGYNIDFCFFIMEDSCGVWW